MASNKNQGGKKGGGFGSMDPKRQREIASQGGRAAHESGHAHEFDSKEAREAGRKGGEAVSQDREHMSEIGRLGGEAARSGGPKSPQQGGRSGEQHGGNH
ncbi:KGG domain-containing protein [Cognatilysobacter lacus]|uniref:General stress protein n=1 Tax=Cognatilysobacter lacus TaxID=1643323 RepID=A0A5D8ZB43_9GAMM|nr:KGG domain-containing protein [Lysobacter lacus]TZF91342.1 general stress protein [Lysobacter lacus]